MPVMERADRAYVESARQKHEPWIAHRARQQQRTHDTKHEQQRVLRGAYANFSRLVEDGLAIWYVAAGPPEDYRAAQAVERALPDFRAMLGLAEPVHVRYFQEADQEDIAYIEHYGWTALLDDELGAFASKAGELGSSGPPDVPRVSLHRRLTERGAVITLAHELYHRAQFAELGEVKGAADRDEREAAAEAWGVEAGEEWLATTIRVYGRYHQR